MADPTVVTVYSRESCHLCDEVIDTVERVAASRTNPIEVREIDVDTDPELRDTYGDRVPYVLIDGRPRFKYRVDEEQFRESLDRAVAGQ